MNTFGSDVLQFPLCDPRAVRENRHRFRRDALPLLERVNSFYCPVGRWPSRGYILLPRAEYNRLDKYSTNLRLYIDKLAPLTGLAIVGAHCVTRGLASDANALYLIEVTDARGILWNKWFSAPTDIETIGYNCRSPAYPQAYYVNTLNSGTPWTWDSMVSDLWAQLSILGTYTGLPSVPLGAPEDLWCSGVAAWPLLCNTLAKLGLVITADHIAGYAIVTAGAADSLFSALQTIYIPNLEDDLEWLDVGAARVPKTVTVFFKRRNDIYGTEETVRRDALQWATTPYYSYTGDAPVEFVNAVGKHFIWDDFTVRYDMDNIPDTNDTITADAIAKERIIQYFGRITGAMTQVYAGALPFVTGSLVDGILWSQDFSNQKRQGWKTTLVRGSSPPFACIWEDLV